MLRFLKRVFGGRAVEPPIGEAPVRLALAGKELAERDLRHSEEHFERLVAGVRDYAIFLLDRQGNVRTWNAGAERLKGYKAEEIVGQHFSRFYPKDAVSSGWPAHELNVASATGRFEEESWRVRKDGTRFWANVVITALRDDSGAVRGFLKITRDLTDRKQAEDKLRLSEERFRLLVEGVEEYAIFMLDPRGQVTTWNAGAERLKGYTAQEIIGQHFSRFYPKEDLESGRPGRKLEIANAIGKCEDEGWRIRKDGSRFWASVVITALRDDAGSLRGFSKIVRDTTERKRAEENARRFLQEEAARRAAEESAQMIQRQREELHVTLASIGDAVMTTDTEGRVTFLNGVAQSLTRWTLDEARGAPLTQVFRVINEQTRQPVENPAERALQEGRVVGLANHSILIAKDGTETPIDDSAAPIRDDKGNVAGVVLIFRDISERKRAEEALRRREQTARFLAHASADLTELTDYESTLQKVASIAVPSFADWCTVDLVDADGTLRRLAVTHTDSAKVHLAHELARRYPPLPDDPHGVPKVIRSGKAELVEDIPDALLAALAHEEEHLRILRELGLQSYICVPMQSKGRTLGVLTFVTAESGRRFNADDLVAADDLARRAAIAIENAGLYRALQDADRRKDEFLATLAHELRNPLAPIRNGLQIMRLEGGNEGPVVPVRDMMERQVQQMARLVDDLLDMSRISRGEIDLHKKRVEAAALVESALETSRPVIEAAAHELVVNVPPHALCVVGDPTRLAQVLANLLNNSAKYTPEGGQIRLTVEREGRQVVLRVRDNGMGIPADMLPKIFDMFTQVDRNLERAQGGLGIGLTLVRRLVEMHGGTVEAHSAGTGQGSEFVVRLPLAPDDFISDPAAGHDSDERAAQLPARRILVVDDNKDSAESLGMLLRLMGNEVRTAYDGPSALVAAKGLRPDLVLLDIGLPGMNGYDVARRMRQMPEVKDAVLVAQTGWGQEEDRRRSSEAGFNTHLVKPVDHVALRKLLASLEPIQEQSRP